MKIKRQKKMKKVMSFYQRLFGFYRPYNILLDATFCQMALKEKVGIQEQLPKYFESELNIVTTQCIIMEVEKLSKVLKELHGGWLVVKQFKVHQCGHKNNLLTAAACVKSLLERFNPNRYIVATMDRELQEHVRMRVCGAPLLYLHGNCPTLESPSPTTKKGLQSMSSFKEKYALKSLKEMKKSVLGKQIPTASKKRKRKSDPNPRAIPKKKKPVEQTTENSQSRKGRRKRRKEEDIQTAIKKVFQGGD